MRACVRLRVRVRAFASPQSDRFSFLLSFLSFTPPFFFPTRFVLLIRLPHPLPRVHLPSCVLAVPCWPPMQRRSPVPGDLPRWHLQHCSLDSVHQLRCRVHLPARLCEPQRHAAPVPRWNVLHGGHHDRNHVSRRHIQPRAGCCRGSRLPRVSPRLLLPCRDWRSQLHGPVRSRLLL